MVGGRFVSVTVLTLAPSKSPVQKQQRHTDERARHCRTRETTVAPQGARDIVVNLHRAMRALAFPEFGTAPALHDLDLPQPAAGEVRVRVHAASVNGCR